MPDAENESAEIPWEQIAGGAAALAAQTRLSEIAARFLALVESWASPSAVLCGYRASSAPEIVHMVPELTSGTLTPSAERAFAKLFADYPSGSLTRPTLVRPTEETAGFKVRDTLVLPWSHGDSVSGFLVLRGLARPHPANLVAALALLAQPLWPYLTRSADASDTSAVEARLRELGRMLGRIEADWRVARTADQSEMERRASRIVDLQDQVASLEKTAATAAAASGEPDAKARQQAEAERDAARGEAADLKARLETAQGEANAARNEAADTKAAAAAAAETAVKARQQAEAERDAARDETADLKARLEIAERDADTARNEASQAKASGSAAAEAKKARELAEAERDAARSEATDLKAKLGIAEREVNAALFEASEAKGAIAASEAAVKARDLAEAERNTARSEAAALRARIETARLEADLERSQAQEAHSAAEATAKARAQAERERDALRGEAADLRTKLESLERELAEARAEAEAARTQPGTGAAERADKPEPDAAPNSERWERLSQSFRDALEAIRRTPFVPPTVRVSCAEAESLLDPKPAANASIARILLLDRDAPMLGALAGELESEGMDVLIAHHPDEVTLFLKTPDARGLTALILDVLSLRSDENLAELVRGWRRDLPGLPLFLTFRADNATEAERAQRIPSTSTAGYLQRPLQKAAVLDAVMSLVRRAAKRAATP